MNFVNDSKQNCTSEFLNNIVKKAFFAHYTVNTNFHIASTYEHCVNNSLECERNLKKLPYTFAVTFKTDQSEITLFDIKKFNLNLK